MDDIDTAAIRAAWPHDTKAGDVIWALADALDAARANLELADSNAVLADMAYAEIDVRYIAKIEARMEVAEARIAAALALIQEWVGPGLARDIRRALTGGTDA